MKNLTAEMSSKDLFDSRQSKKEELKNIKSVSVLDIVGVNRAIELGQQIEVLDYWIKKRGIEILEGRKV